MPSKKIIILGIIALGLIAGILLLGKKPTTQTYDRDTASLAFDVTSGALAKAIEETDSDNDGLKDWEEVLWNTSKDSADSDNDGVNDGEEVKNSRNPAKAGPDDKIELEITASSTARLATGSGEYVELPSTLTSQAGIELFQKYMQLKESGAPINADLQDALIEGLMREVGNQSLKVKVYNEADFTIVDSATKDDLRNYGNTVEAIIKKHSPPTTDTEVTIIAQIAQTEDMSLLPKLGPFLKGYKQIVIDLIALPIPRPIIREHVALVSSMDSVAKDIEYFRKMDTDPLGAATALNQYFNDVKSMSAAIKSLASAFTLHRVSFNQKEGGYIIMVMGQQ